MNLAYTYASSDNGNLQSQAISRGGTSNQKSYSFSASQSNSGTPYDGVNRLKSFTEGSAISDSYSYDAFGNRWVSPRLRRQERAPMPSAR